MWLALRRRGQPAKVAPQKAQVAPTGPSEIKLPFRWRYVVAPNLVLLVAVAAAVYFFRLLPSRVSYGYGSGGTPPNQVAKGLVLLVLLGPQFILALMSAAVAHVVARVGTRFVRDGSTTSAAVESIGTVMSNMVVLPQLVLCYAMIDLFRYNAYGTHLPPLYLFAVLVMLAGGAALGFLFLRAIQHARAVK